MSLILQVASWYSAIVRHIPNGIPGVETRLPILFSEGVKTRRIDIFRFVGLTLTNQVRTYGLYPRKGTIAIGSDADLAIWDTETHRTIRHADPPPARRPSMR